MFRHNEYEIAKNRQNDINREVEQDNLSPKEGAPFYATTLAKIGETMVTVGSKLQAQYGELLEESQTQRANNTPQTTY